MAPVSAAVNQAHVSERVQRSVSGAHLVEWVMLRLWVPLVQPPRLPIAVMLGTCTSVCLPGRVLLRFSFSLAVRVFVSLSHANL